MRPVCRRIGRGPSSVRNSLVVRGVVGDCGEVGQGVGGRPFARGARAFPLSPQATFHCHPERRRGAKVLVRSVALVVKLMRFLVAPPAGITMAFRRPHKRRKTGRRPRTRPEAGLKPASTKQRCDGAHFHSNRSCRLSPAHQGMKIGGAGWVMSSVVIGAPSPCGNLPGWPTGPIFVPMTGGGGPYPRNIENEKALAGCRTTLTALSSLASNLVSVGL